MAAKPRGRQLSRGFSARVPARACLCVKATNLAALKSYAAGSYAPHEVILSIAID